MITLFDDMITLRLVSFLFTTKFKKKHKKQKQKQKQNSADLLDNKANKIPAHLNNDIESIANYHWYEIIQIENNIYSYILFTRRKLGPNFE